MHINEVQMTLLALLPVVTAIGVNLDASIDCIKLNSKWPDVDINQCLSGVVNLTDINLKDDFPNLLPSGLTKLRLQNNRLTGSLPSQLPAALTSLVVVDNQLTGPIPDVLPTSLNHLDLANNQLTGSISNNVPTAITYMSLANNHLTGSLLCLLSNKCKSPLLIFTNYHIFIFSQSDISNNRFTGPVPKSWNFSKFDAFNLRNNLLTGYIPESASKEKLEGFAGNCFINSQEYGLVLNPSCPSTLNLREELVIVVTEIATAFDTVFENETTYGLQDDVDVVETEATISTFEEETQSYEPETEIATRTIEDETTSDAESTVDETTTDSESLDETTSDLDSFDNTSTDLESSDDQTTSDLESSGDDTTFDSDTSLEPDLSTDSASSDVTETAEPSPSSGAETVLDWNDFINTETIPEYISLPAVESDVAQDIVNSFGDQLQDTQYQLDSDSLVTSLVQKDVSLQPGSPTTFSVPPIQSGTSSDLNGDVFVISLESFNITNLDMTTSRKDIITSFSGNIMRVFMALESAITTEWIPFTFPNCNPVTVHMKYAVCDSAIIDTNKCNGEVTGHLKTQELDPKKIPGSGFDDETCRSSIMTAAPIKSLSVFTERPINNAVIAQDLPRIAQIRTAVTTTTDNKALSPFPLPTTTSAATRFSSSATAFLIAAIPTTFAKAIDLVPIPPSQSPSSTLAFNKPGPTSSSGISPQIEIEQKTKSVMSTIPTTKPVLTTEEQIVSDLIMSSSKSPERNFFSVVLYFFFCQL
ncbi:hypothetical protein HDU79_005961 [Rhizoclosmatium sp. JEL0117]|nr:hypothetical protein HDU79_005961 [Rhizoclosmatium sp. JEL0117]